MQEKSPRRSNPERTEATRAVLLAAARRLFTEKGYAETGTPEIVAAAGVTRGALYHHFADKRALFAALVEQESALVASAIEEDTAESADPVDALSEGSRAFFRAMAVPGRCRLLLIDGPAVLGRAEMDRIDLSNGAGSLRDGLSAAIAAGSIRPLPLDVLTAQLSALFDRAALGVDQGDNLEDHVEVVAAIIRGLAPRLSPARR